MNKNQKTRNQFSTEASLDTWKSTNQGSHVVLKVLNCEKLSFQDLEKILNLAKMCIKYQGYHTFLNIIFHIFNTFSN